MSASMLSVYGDLKSGNCYKVKLLLTLLDKPHQWHPIDILTGESKKPAFLAINPIGKIPVLQIDEQTFLAESNAILNYLATGSSFLPTTPLARAEVLKWQFFEQYSHEPNIAVARFNALYLGLSPQKQIGFEARLAAGKKALQIMDDHLSRYDYFVGDRLTIADISLYAYTHVADEGGFHLSDYPALCQWMARLKAVPGFRDMKAFLDEGIDLKQKTDA